MEIILGTLAFLGLSVWAIVTHFKGLEQMNKSNQNKFNAQQKLINDLQNQVNRLEKNLRWVTGDAPRPTSLWGPIPDKFTADNEPTVPDAEVPEIITADDEDDQGENTDPVDLEVMADESGDDY